MSLSSTLFLKSIIGIFSLAILSILVFVIPFGIMADQTGYYRPILFGLYVTAIPFFIAIFQLFKLLNNIDQSQTFSADSVLRLKNTKICGLIISGLFATALPYIFYAAGQDDAPGVLLAALLIIGGSFIVASVAALLQRLLQNAADIKSENDLTV